MASSSFESDLTRRLYEEMGSRIKHQREAAGLTQEGVAVRVGLSRTSITNIEAGRQALTVHGLYRLASALSVEPSQLLPPDAALVEEAALDLPEPLRGTPQNMDVGRWMERIVDPSRHGR